MSLCYGTVIGRLKKKERKKKPLASPRLSVRMEQLGSHTTDFHEILYLRIFRKTCRENSIFIKI
jgi:hypothetical protein